MGGIYCNVTIGLRGFNIFQRLDLTDSTTIPNWNTEAANRKNMTVNNISTSFILTPYY